MKTSDIESGEWVSVMDFLKTLGGRYSDSATMRTIEYLAKKNKGIFSKSQARSKSTKGFHRRQKLQLYNSPNNRNFVLYLLFLRSFLEPKLIKRIVEGEGYSLGNEIDQSFDTIRQRIHHLSFALTQEKTLKERILNSSLDLTEMLLMQNSPSTATATLLCAENASSISVPEDIIARLHHLRIIEDSEEKCRLTEATPGDLAKQALHYFQMGCFDISKRLADSVLEVDKTNGMACYVSALLFLRYSTESKADANEALFISEITETDESGSVSDAKHEEAVNHLGAATISKIDAIRLLIFALKSWPSHGGRPFHVEHWVRALRIILSEASVLSDEFQRYRDRNDVDSDDTHCAILLKILKQEERMRSYTFSTTLSPAKIDLQWLHLYYLLDEDSYRRFGKEWITGISKLWGSALIELQSLPLFTFHLEKLISQDRGVMLLKELQAVIVDWQQGQTDAMIATIKFNQLKAVYDSADFEASLCIVIQLIELGTKNRLRYEYLYVRILYDWSQRLLRDNKTYEASEKCAQIFNTYPDILNRFSSKSWLEYLIEINSDFCKYADDLGNTGNILFQDEYAHNKNVPSLIVSLCKKLGRVPDLSAKTKACLKSVVNKYATLMA